MTKKKTEVKALTFHDVMIEAIAQQGDMDEAKSGGVAVSAHLLTLAKTFKLVGTSPTGNKEFKGECSGFLGECFQQEVWAKSSDAGIHQVDAIPRCWTNAKATIKAAMVLGIALEGFETESELRKAVQAKREDDKAPEAGAIESDITPLMTALANVYAGLTDDAQKNAFKG